MLLNELDHRSLSARDEMAPAFAGKGAAARRDLVDRFTPEANTVRLPAALLASDTDLNDYLARVKASILAAGYPVSVEA